MTNNLLLKPIRNTLISMTLLCTLSACQTTNYNADSQFTAVADSIVDYRQSSSPYGNIEGVNGYLLANLSPEFLEQQYNKKTQFLARHNTHQQCKKRYGFHSGLSYIINSSQYKTLQNYQTYLARLAQVPRFFEQNIYWMKKGLETGLTQPKAVLEGYEESISAYIVEDVTTSEYYKPFLKNNAGLPESEFKSLQQRAQSVIKDKVIE